MPYFAGKLTKDENDQIYLTIPLSKKNPTLTEIPLTELLEDLFDKEVMLDIWPVEPTNTYKRSSSS